MIPVKMLGKVYEIPGGWDEVTCRQFIELLECKEISNPALVLSILAGIEYRILMNANPKEIEANVLSRLTFLGQDVGLESFILPETVTVNGAAYSFPKNLRAETWGQKITAQMLINEASTTKAPLIKIAAEMVAIYLQPIIDGPTFDDKKIKVVAEMVKDSKLCEVYPVAAFFLKQSVQFAATKVRS
jgi:hypothetical protein